VDNLAHMFSLLHVIELIFAERDITTSFSSDSIIEDLKSLKERRGALSVKVIFLIYYC